MIKNNSGKKIKLKQNGKRNRLFQNGILLAAVFVFLLIRFIYTELGAVQVVVLSVIAGLSAFQFILQYFFTHGFPDEKEK